MQIFYYLDEAFSAVDIGAEEDVMKIINDIKQDGKTILIATHDINNIEEKFDEVLMFEQTLLCIWRSFRGS